MVAGEASGDLLGASLVRALRARYPQATFEGVTGPALREAGCASVATIDQLSVMGLAEVLRHLPRLLKLRRDLVGHFARQRPDVYIGVDAPDFNLRVERPLRAAGIRTVHFVSPTIWAWRPGRVHGIGRAASLVLCLYPFEPPLYAKHGLRAAFTGHPMADELDDSVTPAQAREALGLPPRERVVGLLPGSRHGELKYLAEPFAAAAAALHAREAGLHFVAPIARPDLRPVMEAAIARHPGPRWTLLEGRSREAMRAADAVLLASGTATLECLLLGRPMVVAYRTSWLTAFLMLKAGLLKIPYVSLPNILSGGALVTELLQDAATPARMADELQALLNDPARREAQREGFRRIHATLRQDAGERAAAAIAELLA